MEGTKDNSEGAGVTPAEQARRDVEAWRETVTGGLWIPSLAVESLIATVTPVYERAARAEATRRELGHHADALPDETWQEELDRALERAERAEASLTAALAGEDNQAQRAQKAEAELASLQHAHKTLCVGYDTFRNRA